VGAQVVWTASGIAFPENKFFSVNIAGEATEKNIRLKRIVPMGKINRKYFKIGSTCYRFPALFEFNEVGHSFRGIVYYHGFHFPTSLVILMVASAVSVWVNFVF